MYMSSIIKQIVQVFKKFVQTYNKSSVCGKILGFIILLLALVMTFKNVKNDRIEGFEQHDTFLFKTGSEIYDDFYADIYDHLVFNTLKDDYEVGQIVNKTSPNTSSKILDIGSGTGHHVSLLKGNNLDVVGIDISPSMIKKAKENYPQFKFQVGDAMDGNTCAANTYTHILCLYFTIYYFEDKARFFQNCMKWLMPGGYVIVHIVDRDKFDPILPPGNPLLLVSPQKYATERITSTSVKFTDFKYSADFQMDSKKNTAKFIEKFKNDKNGKVRKNEHIFYMEDKDEIVQLALSSGLILEGQIDLIECQYEYQYLYIFTKPN